MHNTEIIFAHQKNNNNKISWSWILKKKWKNITMSQNKTAPILKKTQNYEIKKAHMKTCLKLKTGKLFYKMCCRF